MTGDQRPWRTVRTLAAACHPVPTIGVTVLGTALAVAVGRDAAGAVVVALAIASGQLSIGWSNDAIDQRDDVAAGRTDKPLAILAAEPTSGGSAAASFPATDHTNTGAHLRSAVWRAALWSVAACVPLSLASGLGPGAAHLVGVAAGWSYNLGLKRTLVSWAPYAVGFAMLVVFAVAGTPGAGAPPWWLVLSGSLIGVGAHFANVLPDLEYDAAAAVRGLPQRLGRVGATLACAACFVAATVLLLVGSSRPPSGLGWVFAFVAVVSATVGAVIAARTRAHWPFVLIACAAAADLVLLVIAT